ncbi:MAG: GH116 family glycosyl hydrolase [Bacteroidota bacterium]
MKRIFLIAGFLGLMSIVANGQESRYNTWYSGPRLNHVNFPMGGIGAGMIGLEGNGAWSQMSVGNQPDVLNEPFAFAAISVKGFPKGAKVLQGSVPDWKIFGLPGTGDGRGSLYYGLPRFEKCRFITEFPSALIELADDDIPLDIAIRGWSPFIPGDADNSSLPVGSMDYTFTNISNQEIEAVFSWNSKNIISKNESNEIIPCVNGFTCVQKGDSAHPEYQGWFSVFTNEPAVVDHCWFRGDWYDALTLVWKDIGECRVVADAPKGPNPPGASLFVPIKLAPGESKTINLMFCWYFPETRISSGTQPAIAGAAFQKGPVPGTAEGQQQVSGFAGSKLVNTYYPDGDGLTGTLQSSTFKIRQSYIAFLIGGGEIPKEACINLVIDDEVVRTATGKNAESLKKEIWDVRDLKGKTAAIEIVDNASGSWGHIYVDQIVFTNNAQSDPGKPGSTDLVFEDFEGENYGTWTVAAIDTKDCSGCEPGTCETPRYYKPWYAGRFKSIDDISTYWKRNYQSLRSGSELFAQTFYASTLPPEVIEAVAANLGILKSPTVLRDQNGKFWAWEGCGDKSGCCAGSCTHVWNYAQAVPHLFPDLERSLRETEFTVSQNDEGHQTFRAALPISEPEHTFHAASDGQLGGIMKVYREWRISGDNAWISNLYPFVKQSIDYCIKTWDPDHTGVLVEPHHNTYDIEFWGPDGMCSSFYLGALTAFVEMSKFLDKPAADYEALLAKGKIYLENNLFNGEYFFQKIRWADLHAADPTKTPPDPNSLDDAYDLLVKEGPKYQYGTGCLSDGIMGMWLASVCGLPEVVNNDKVTSHLVSVHKYNLKNDLTDHDNPQRPAFAMGKEGGLLICTWPKGGQLSLPFVYSHEVWTGIEYQVASHLMLHGEVEKGLDIVRACRDRYDGVVRNPFDEYECGHWYARALSSYGLIQGLTGLRYDAVDKTLYIKSQIGNNFQAFISTATGYGLAGLKDGRPFIDVKSGMIPVVKFLVE